jgi:hypothetical protein
MSEKVMTVLVKKKMLKGVKGIHIEKCSDCLADKQHRVASRVSLLTRSLRCWTWYMPMFGKCQ